VEAGKNFSFAVFNRYNLVQAVEFRAKFPKSNKEKMNRDSEGSVSPNI
jgi:hypothetical protein